MWHPLEQVAACVASSGRAATDKVRLWEATDEEWLQAVTDEERVRAATDKELFNWACVYAISIAMECCMTYQKQNMVWLCRQKQKQEYQQD